MFEIWLFASIAGSVDSSAGFGDASCAGLAFISELTLINLFGKERGGREGRSSKALGNCDEGSKPLEDGFRRRLVPAEDASFVAISMKTLLFAHVEHRD